jgi:hypothetical protein
MSDFRYFTTRLYQSGSTANPVIAELPLTNVSFDAQLNSIGTFTGELLLSGVDFITNSSGSIVSKLNIFDGTTPGKTILWVDYGGKLIWSGVIWQREWDSGTETLKITGQEMLSYFKRRRITDNLQFPNPSSTPVLPSDPALIAEYLMVQYAQGQSGSGYSKEHGNIGLHAQSSIPTVGISTARSYYDFELKEVYQAVKDLSDGLDSSSTTPFFDFLITPSYNSSNLPINTFTIQIPFSSSSYVTLQLPGNITEYSYVEDASIAANTLFGMGYGSNASKTIAVATDDSTVNYPTTWGSISSYGDAALLEDAASFIDISNIGLLEAVTVGQMNAVARAPITMQVVIMSYVDPYLGTFNLGDQVFFYITDDMFPNGVPSNYDGTLNYYWRVVGISVQPGEDKTSRVTLTISQPYINYGNVTQKTVSG